MIGEENEQKFIELELQVTGELLDVTPFEDSDAIKVKNPLTMKMLKFGETLTKIEREKKAK